MSHTDRLTYHFQLTHVVNTAQRRHVFEALDPAQPTSLDDLQSRTHGHVSRATLFRTLNLFRQYEIINQLEPGVFELTDRFRQHHHYLICRHCHQRFAFNDAAAERAIQKLATSRHFILEDHTLQLTGLCTRCANQTPARTAIGTNYRRAPGLK